jgi:hypothetical protein
MQWTCHPWLVVSLEREAQARGEVFVRLDEETLRRKTAGDEANTPFFDGWSMSPGKPGGSASVTVYAYNPSPGDLLLLRRQQQLLLRAS